MIHPWRPKDLHPRELSAVVRELRFGDKSLMECLGAKHLTRWARIEVLGGYQIDQIGSYAGSIGLAWMLTHSV